MRLHPAIVRPGRRVAQIHVGPLSRTEAIAWLGAKATSRSSRHCFKRQPVRDRLVREPLTEEIEDLQLPRREA